jgi:hypothetical protein
MRPFATLMTALAFTMSGMTFSPVQAAVVNFACPAGGGTYQVNSGAVTGTTGSCSGDLTLDGSVTTLDTYAFASAQLSSLTIPAAVTTISGSTFASYGNSSLVSITVAGANPNYSSTDGVLFDKLSTELIVYPASKPGASYTIPSSVTAIRYYGFAGNKFLTSLDIPNTVTNLEGQNFMNSERIATINVGTGLANLGEQSFAYIQTLSAINVNPSNTYFASIDGVLYSKDISTLWAYPIGKTATSYTAPNTVTATKYTVFGQASNLLTVDLTSVATLSGQEFESSTSIREITFGNSLTQLKNQTLQAASGLQKLYLGTGLTTITNGAFWGNTSLNCVVYAGSNPTIQNYAYPNGVVPVANSSCLADSVSSLTPIIANAYRADKLGSVYFAPLSSKLSKAAKRQLAAAIIANPSAVYKITGYVQKSIFAKNAKNNSSLSLARAKAIETYLVSLGAGVNFTVVVDAGKVPAKNGTSSKARRATLYAMTPVVQ